MRAPGGKIWGGASELFTAATGATATALLALLAATSQLHYGHSLSSSVVCATEAAICLSIADCSACVDTLQAILASSEIGVGSSTAGCEGLFSGVCGAFAETGCDPANRELVDLASCVADDVFGCAGFTSCADVVIDHDDDDAAAAAATTSAAAATPAPAVDTEEPTTVPPPSSSSSSALEASLAPTTAVVTVGPLGSTVAPAPTPVVAAPAGSTFAPTATMAGLTSVPTSETVSETSVPTPSTSSASPSGGGGRDAGELTTASPSSADGSRDPVNPITEAPSAPTAEPDEDVGTSSGGGVGWRSISVAAGTVTRVFIVIAFLLAL